MIEVENLSEKYGDKLAVDDLSFTVQPGIVTGFRGPNGAGKSATMRMIAGLDLPAGGHVRVNGKDYRECPAGMAELGVLVEAKAVERRSDAVRCWPQPRTVALGRIHRVLRIRDRAHRRCRVPACAGRRMRLRVELAHCGERHQT